uniref:Uncharacterized protein, MTH1187 family n=1 Tax=Candidatus Kentrum sp. TUN TaxID=2126343 RepID=A0A450ZE16_9GAMM|nr:MAG: uncharacterized protein, MTH1187 family [Candidatus Kentron sp. TUN]VFK51044.1 MAG: uncharacterized protein, MTH1187 family [Candidatus Kentron sp. TUN]VFK52023.1 MAG: uncharacterized protein, MTH1187 family [Candidatus Kentron sp. TUN]
MSVLLEISMFPIGEGESVSQYVSQVVKMIKGANVDYQLTPMGTVVETDNLRQALDLIEQAYDLLNELGCNRVYSVLKFDIRKGKTNRLSQKIQSVTEKIGTVSTAG